MATLPEQQAARPEVQINWQTPSVGGDDFVNTGVQIILVKNVGTTQTVTVETTATLDGNAVDDLDVASSANSHVMSGPFDPTIYGTSVSLTYSGTTDIEIAVIRIA